MKATPGAVCLVAVASSLATVGTMELLRGSSDQRPATMPDSPLGSPVTAGASPGTRDEPLVPVPAVQARQARGEGHEDRLAELERRIAALELAALELGGSARRAAATPAAGEPSAREDLRELVLGWVAEEREARGRERELEREEERQRELEFEAQFHAYMVGEQYGLADWQQEELAELFLEIEERRSRIEEEIDPARDDPREVEARWVAFDEWAERLERELAARLDPAFYQDLYGDG